MIAKTKNGKFDKEIIRVINYIDIWCNLYDVVLHTMIHPRNIINNAMESYRLTKTESELHLEERGLSGRMTIVTSLSSFCNNIAFWSKKGNFIYNLKSADITDFSIMMMSENNSWEEFTSKDIPYALRASAILALTLLDLRTKKYKKASAEIDVLEGDILRISIKIDENEVTYSRRKI